MGLAASQARYLALTARKSDLEYQSQTINTRRLQLAYKTAEIARAYSDGMNNKIIAISDNSTNKTDGNTTKIWNELTFKNLYDGGFMLIGTGGTGLNPAPYLIENSNIVKNYIPVASKTFSEEEYKDLVKDNKYNENAFLKNETTTDTDEETGEKKEKTVSYKLNPNMASIEGFDFEQLSDEMKAYFKTTEVTKTNYRVNENYVDANGMDIQSLLVSGKAQIVTKAFYDFLSSEYGYNYADGITPEQYAEALDDWENEDSNVNAAGAKSVIDWRADEDSGFKQRYYTEDDADVLAKYEAETAEVQAQDKILEVEEKNIETQHKAIENEMENVKKVIQKNIEETFKIFS